MFSCLAKFSFLEFSRVDARVAFRCGMYVLGASLTFERVYMRRGLWCCFILLACELLDMIELC